MGICATTRYMHIQRHHLTIRLQLCVGHVGEKNPRACFCGCAVPWRTFLNILVFVFYVKENRASSVLVYERFLALLRVQHFLPSTGRIIFYYYYYLHVVEQRMPFTEVYFID